MRLLRAFSGLFTLAIVLALVAWIALDHPQSPLPPEWNPTLPLDVAAPLTPITGFKLSRAMSGAACLDALATADAQVTALPDLDVSDVCHVRDRVRLSALGATTLSPVETRCATALRMAMWLEHGIRPAARDILDREVTRLHHFSSYNCRPIRTSRGNSTRMSTHATGDAIDISGVTLDGGVRADLLEHWDTGEKGRLLRVMRDTSCDWFGTTLGPDYNALHADHFHLQNRGWGRCS